MLDYIRTAITAAIFFPSILVASTSINYRLSLDNILKEAANQVQIGIQVTDLTNGQTVYEKNAARTYTPASNQKIITAAAGLWYLGPDYRFKTRIYRTLGDVHHGQFEGNIVIKFAGDPELTIPDLSQLILALAKQEGISDIHGDLIIDQSLYGEHNFGPGWTLDDIQHCFSAPIGANILNQNCIRLGVAPGNTVNSPITILPNHTNAYISLINHATTQSQKTAGCYLQLKTTSHNHYILEGCLPLKAKPQAFSMAVEDPTAFAREVITRLLAQHHIRLQGQIKTEVTNHRLKLIAEHQSAPLIHYIQDMLKKSDNLISDSLFKKLGSLYFKEQGSWSKGSKAIKHILRDKANMMPFSGMIADGSGLSRYNLTSPQQLVHLLEKIYQSPTLAPLFIEALPIAGIDGTLKYRMNTSETRGKVKAKTGTMANITALSGFIYTKNQKVLAFSIMINGIVGSTVPYRLLTDQICEFLVENY